MEKKSFLKNLKYDLPAGIVVFFVALPLCLGIALASGAPLFAGIIGGIIGGIIIGVISGSHTSVSGPAAGLIIIVITAIGDLGSYEAFLLAVVFAGVLQLIFGFLKAGIVSLFFPSNVIKGMLTAIGITLILKQIPHFLGVDKDAFGEEEFFQSDGNTTFSYLVKALGEVHWGGFIAGSAALIILLFWDSKWIKGNKVLSQIPGAVVAVIAAVGINQIYLKFTPELSISKTHLVNLPSINNWSDLQSYLLFPDFGAVKNIHVYITAFTLAVVASLETLLSLEAVDKLDAQKRRSPQNRELIAQGIGNIFSGLVGGLPITSVIVRSSANINSGAKTKSSAIMHGFLLLLAVLFLAPIINQIPLSALSAILILVGYKLAKVSLFVQQFKLGKEQFIPFIVTVVAILFSDLLIGISIGLVVGLLFILKANYNIPYFSTVDNSKSDNKIIIKLSEHISFLNKPSLFKKLTEIPENSNLVIDGSNTQTIDYDVLELIQSFNETAVDRKIKLELISIPSIEKK